MYRLAENRRHLLLHGKERLYYNENFAKNLEIKHFLTLDNKTKRIIRNIHMDLSKNKGREVKSPDYTRSQCINIDMYRAYVTCIRT